MVVTRRPKLIIEVICILSGLDWNEFVVFVLVLTSLYISWFLLCLIYWSTSLHYCTLFQRACFNPGLSTLLGLVGCLILVTNAALIKQRSTGRTDSSEDLRSEKKRNNLIPRQKPWLWYIQDADTFLEVLLPTPVTGISTKPITLTTSMATCSLGFSGMSWSMQHNLFINHKRIRGKVEGAYSQGEGL